MSKYFHLLITVFVGTKVFLLLLLLDREMGGKIYIIGGLLKDITSKGVEKNCCC
jgi:hypothetical protein